MSRDSYNDIESMLSIAIDKCTKDKPAIDRRDPDEILRSLFVFPLREQRPRELKN